MDTQPNEIIIYILSYLDNRELTLARRVNHKWKKFIEDKIFNFPIPSRHVCILTNDYYHFRKYYWNHDYYNETKTLSPTFLTDRAYYFGLAMLADNTHMGAWFVSNNEIQSKNFQSNEKLSNAIVLTHAAYLGHLEVIKYLINKGESILDHKYILSFGAKYGHLEIVKYAVMHGIDIHENNNSALYFSITEKHANIARYLASCGADIHVRNEFYLWDSAASGNLEMVKLFVELGADINKENGKALMAAAKCNHLEIVKYLIENGANIHINHDHVIHTAMICGSVDVIQYLINQGMTLNEFSFDWRLWYYYRIALKKLI